MMEMSVFPSRLRAWGNFLSDEDGWTSSLNSAFDRIGFTEEYVREASKSPPRTQAVKDRVWGMIEFDSSAAALVNCPLLQRLRSVKQLGFSSFTYPSADHSRFVHSMGVYEVVGRLLQEFETTKTLQSSLGTAKLQAASFDNAEKDYLRYAAILHDIGHGPFSHASERYFQIHDEMEMDSEEERAESGMLHCMIGPFTIGKFKHKFHHYYKGFDDGRSSILPTGKAPISEMLAVALLVSDRFRSYYDVTIGSRDAHGLHDVYYISALILGDRITKGDFALPSILSGSIDADKIDYMQRDADACRISLGLDIPRVFMRAGVYDINKSRDPFASGLSGLDDIDTVRIFVIDQHGGDTFVEMGNSRLSLYRRVYQHPFTRNVEGHYFALLNEAGKYNVEFRDLLKIWSTPEDCLIEALCQHPVSHVSGMSWAIRRRQMPKKAAIIGNSVIRPVLGDVAVREKSCPVWQQVGGMVKAEVSEVVEIIDDVDEVINPIMQHCELIYRKLEGAGTTSDQLPAGSAPETLRIIPCPETNDAMLKQARVLTVSKDVIASEFRHASYTDAGHLPHQTTVLLTDSKWREIALLACQRAFIDIVRAHPKRRHPVPFRYTYSEPQGNSNEKRERTTGFSVDLLMWVLPVLDTAFSSRACHANLAQLEEFQGKLALVGYYDDLPFLFPYQGDEAKIDCILERCGAYSGEQEWRIDRHHIRVFLSQFPYSLRGEMVDLLMNIEMFGRSEIEGGVVSLLLQLQQEVGNRILAVPFTPSSGHLVRLFINKLFENNSSIEVHSGLRNAVLEPRSQEPIVFVDDHVSSGTQAAKQIKAICGMLGADEKDSNIFCQPLDGDALQKLRERDIYFVFYGASVDGEEMIKKACDEAGMRFAGLRSRKKFDELQFDASPNLEQFLAKVGRGLMLGARRRDFPEEAIKNSLTAVDDRVVGYGNKRGVTVTPFNVPTSTYTALWCPGWYRPDSKYLEHDDQVSGRLPWLPLFLRTGQFRNLVIF